MKHLYIFVVLLPLFALAQNYPATKKTLKTITKHGISYNDDYTWLENIRSPEVTAWVAAQNKVTDKYLNSIGTTTDIEDAIATYAKGSTYALPAKRGKYFYVKLRTDDDRPSSLFYFKKLDDRPVKLVDPARVYDKHATIMSYHPSKNSKLLAYKVSLDGSDKHEVRFVNIEKEKYLDDVIANVKYSNISWKDDEGVFYKRNTNTVAFARDSTFQLLYHAMGTLQKDDKIVFDRSSTGLDFNFNVDEDKLLITEWNKEKTKKSYYYILLSDSTYTPVKFIEDESADFNILNYSKGRIYYATKQYDWGEIRSCDINNRKDEKVIIPQFYNQLLVNTFFASDYIICQYKTLGKYYLSVYDAEINFIRKFEAPYGMDFKMLFIDKETNRLFVNMNSYVIGPQNYTLNLKTGEFDPYYNNLYKAKATLFPLDHFETKTITFKSRDNKDVPVTIIHKKGMELNGNNPALLEAYGGFGVISNPAYDVALLYFLEKGGVYAFAEIRGGGEKGLNWHTQGMGLKKTNSVNDFVDVAEFLITKKYTSANRLGISGGSNGGLVAGAAMVQRPDLFKAVICKVGLFDMAIFDNYTTGNKYVSEYGNPDVKEDYVNLLSYSPYQNIKEDVNYPATLIITADNDDRVLPLHSYKFAARLQNRASQTNPVYLKSIKNSGHNGTANYNGSINDEAEFYSFLMYHLNR